MLSPIASGCVRTLTILVALCGALRADPGGLRTANLPNQPYRDKYALFADSTDDRTWFYVPLRIELVPKSDHGPSFGMQYSGYGHSDPSGKSASATLTFQYVASEAELSEVKRFIGEQKRLQVSLAPVASMEYTVWLVTPNLDRTEPYRTKLASASTTPSSTMTLTLELSALGAQELRDLFTDNRSGGGLIIETSLQSVLHPAPRIILETAPVATLFQTMRSWNGTQSVDDLAAVVESTTKLGTSSLPALRAWLAQLLGEPDKLEMQPNAAVAVWRLDGDQIQTALHRQPTVSLTVGEPSSAPETFFTAFSFDRYCQLYSDRFVDLTTMKSGCANIKEQKGQPK